MNAFVEATPISGPALVNNTKSDSLARELVGTLQIASEARYSFSLAKFKAAKVSAVSPDCEIVMIREF